MLHLFTHFNTLTMKRTLLLLFPLLFGGGCEARNATAIQSSHPEINTFFGTTSLSERSRPYSRFKPDSLFSQIPPTIKWERVVSLTNTIRVPSRQSLPMMGGETLLIAPYNESERGTFHLLDRKVVKSTLTNRTINGCHISYLKKYSRPISSYPDSLTSSGKLDHVLRNGLNASADNKSVSGFFKFSDRKVNAFPHFLSLRSRSFSLPTHEAISSDQKLKNQKLADGACLLISCISSLDGNVSQARVAHLVWLHDDIHRGVLFLLFAFVASFLFFYCFFSSSSCTATHERRKKQNRKLATTLNTCKMPTMNNHKGSTGENRAIHSLSTSNLRSKSNSNLKSKSSSTDLKKKKILNDDSKLSKSNNELMRNQRQKLKTKRKSKITTERSSSGRGRSRRVRGSTQRRQRGRYYLVQQSSRKLRIARNHKKKKRYKKNKKKEKILKLISFHHYKMKQEIFDSMNGDIMSHLCLLIMVIFLVSTFCL